MSSKAKRKHISPIKGNDKCAACSTELDEGSSAIECDICEKWICGECLDLSPGEYKLLSKMMQSLTCSWSCPACKVNPPPPHSSEQAMINKLASVMDNSLKSFREDLKQEFATTSQLTQTLSQLRTDIKSDISAQVSDIANRVSHIENSLQSVCSTSTVQDLVVSTVSSKLSQLLSAQLSESDVY